MFQTSSDQTKYITLKTPDLEQFTEWAKPSQALTYQAHKGRPLATPSFTHSKSVLSVLETSISGLTE